MQDSLKVLFVFNSLESSGGGFQQEFTTFLTIKRYNRNHQFQPIATSRRLFRQLKKRVPELQLAKVSNRFLHRHRFDLVFYSYPAEITHDFNYIVTIWDFFHRDFPEFPEVRLFGEHHEREKLYRRYSDALAILVDSKRTQLDLIRRYGFDPSRIRIARYLPPPMIESKLKSFAVKEYYKIRSDYVFYPVQFWSHKNHIYILNGLKILKDDYDIDLTAVFTGEDYGNLERVQKYAQHLDLEDQVRYLGFVNREHIKFIYQQSLALVMPSYLGPTNLPPLEAAMLDVPIFYGEEHKEFMKDGAIYIDLSHPADFAEKFHQFYRGKIDRKKLLRQAKQVAQSWTDQNYWEEIDQVLKKYLPLKKSWDGYFYNMTLWRRSLNYFKKNGLRLTLEKIISRIFS